MKRQCGGCSLCCKLLPVSQISKAAAERCPHQRYTKGCAIYASRPESCRVWSCQWLLGGDDVRDLPRPDRSHYVIDPMPDFVRLTSDDSAPIELPVIQIWLDAGYPDAHRDPALRAYLEMRAKATGMGALVRIAGNNDALGLFAPSISEDRQWHEVTTNFKPEMQHSAADIARVMAKLGLKVEVELGHD